MKRLLALGLIALLAASANAATVKYYLVASTDTGSGSFELYVEDMDAQPDNYGIVACGVVLTGDIDSITREQPRARWADDEYWEDSFWYVLGDFRAADLITGGATVTGSQNLVEAPRCVVKGLGQTTIDPDTFSTFEEIDGGNGEDWYLDNDWGATIPAKFLLASGTYTDATTLDIDLTHIDTAARVFTSATGTGNAAATIEKQVTLIPEPATMALIGIGGLALLRRKRR